MRWPAIAILYTWNARKDPPSADILLQITRTKKKGDWVDRGFGIWVPQLAPSWELFNRFQGLKKQNLHLENWENYVEDYTAEQMKDERFINQLVKRLTEGKSVAVACFCYSPENCHRKIVAEMVKRKLPDITVNLF